MVECALHKLILVNQTNSGVIKLTKILNPTRRSLLLSVVGILKSPLSCLLQGACRVGLPVIGDFLIKGIVQVRCRHKSLDGKKHGSDLEGRRPFGLEDIKADSTEFVDVGVIDFCSEKDLWRNHGVVVWQKELAVKDTTLVGSFGGPSDFHIEVAEVFFRWLSIDSDNGVLSKSLSFLKKVRP